MQHAERGERVGAEMGGVAGERRRAVALGLPPEEERDAGVGERREADHRDADAELLDPGSRGEPVDRLVDDQPGAREDQHPLDRRGEALELLVAVGVLDVGGLVGAPDRDEGDHRGDQVDHRVKRLAQDRDRAGDRGGRELQRDQHRVRGDRDRGRPRLGDPAAADRPGRAHRVTSTPRCAASFRGRSPAVADRVLLVRRELRHRAVVVRAGVVGDEGRVVAEAAGAPRLIRQDALAAALEQRSPRRPRRPGRSRRRRRPGGRPASPPRRAASPGSPRRSRPRRRSGPSARRAGRRARRPRSRSRRRSPSRPVAACAARALPSAFSAKVSPVSGGSSTSSGSGSSSMPGSASRSSRSLCSLRVARTSAGIGGLDDP